MTPSPRRRCRLATVGGGGDAWPGFPFPYTWPEGEAWAADELAELSKPLADTIRYILQRG